MKTSDINQYPHGKLAIICAVMALVVPIASTSAWILRGHDFTRSQAEMLYDFADENLDLSDSELAILSAGVRQVHRSQTPFSPEVRLIYPLVFGALAVFHSSRYFNSLRRATEAQPGATDNPDYTQRLREDH